MFLSVFGRIRGGADTTPLGGSLPRRSQQPVNYTFLQIEF